MIPYDQKGPQNPSGIRLGTPFLTSRGMKEKEMKQIAKILAKTLKHKGENKVQQQAKNLVLELCKKFPI